MFQPALMQINRQAFGTASLQTCDHLHDPAPWIVTNIQIRPEDKTALSVPHFTSNRMFQPESSLKALEQSIRCSGIHPYTCRNDGRIVFTPPGFEVTV
jgi:hypothetical protein